MTTSQRSRTVRAYPFSPPDRLVLDPQYAWLREHEPVPRVRMPYGEEAWLVTRYADVRTVLGDARFSRAASIGRDEPRVAPQSPGAACWRWTRRSTPGCGGWSRRRSRYAGSRSCARGSNGSPTSWSTAWSRPGHRPTWWTTSRYRYPSR